MASYFVTAVIVGLVSALLGYLSHVFYFVGGRCTSKKRLDGKVAIITGSNTGIGYETALDFARRGAKVIMACRNLKKAEQAADKIRLETGNRKVEVEHLDLTDLHSVKDFALRMKEKITRLDLLINNAGVMDFPYSRTKQEFELHFGVNYLGHFLLTNLLLDLLKNTVGSRVINVSSVGHLNKNAKLDWEDLHFAKEKNGMNRYFKSKLANVLFAYELAERLKGTGVTSVSLHPGVVRTEILRLQGYQSTVLEILLFIFSPIWLVISKSSEEGAQTTIHCALDDTVPDYNGLYFSDCKPTKMSEEVTRENSKRLWEISEDLLKSYL